MRFSAWPEILGLPYFRVFRHAGLHYALGMPGVLYRSRDGLEKFERGPMLFGPDTRHMALLQRDDELLVFWTRVGDAPEHILCSRIALGRDWTAWRASEPFEVLRPEAPWEGADLPPAPSIRGAALEPLNQLRDPCIFEEEGAPYLLYSVAGESGIAIARLDLDDLGAEVGEQHARHRPRHALRELQDPDPVECARHDRHYRSRSRPESPGL